MPKAAIFLLSILFLFACSRIETGELVDDRDGRVYQTVKIGENWWMAENLAYMPYVSYNQSDSGIWVWGYDGDSHGWASKLIDYQTYGCLYSWSAAMNITSEYDSILYGAPDEIQQGICPDGWHLPSDQEWTELEEYLDTQPDFTANDERQHSGDAGLQLKADTLWTTPVTSKHATGFNALPGGIHYRTHFFLNQGTYGYFWTSTEQYAKSAIYRYLMDTSDGTFRGFPAKTNGLSIRCIKPSQ